MQPLAESAYPNTETVRLLEHWLQMARAGQVHYVALVGVQNLAQVTCNFAGNRGLEFAANYGLDVLKLRIMEGIDRAPTVSEPTNADHVCFNVSTGSVSFDFICWLVIAEMRRRAAGAPAPLKVGFVIERSEEGDHPVREYRRKMLTNVMKPALPLIGAIESAKAAKEGNTVEACTFGPIVTWARQGQQVPRFTPSKQATRQVNKLLDAADPVTITLREAQFHPHRNSNLPEWIKFARWLRQQGEYVVFVRDTAKAGEAVEDFTTLAEASTDLDCRMALYESARCNLFVSNGPCVLACFGSRPWLLFNALSPLDPYAPNTPQWWKQFQGIGPGEQLPWSAPDQRIIWQADEFEIIKAAWIDLKLPPEMENSHGEEEKARREAGNGDGARAI